MSTYIGKIQTHYPAAKAGLTKASSGTKMKKILISIGSSILIGGIIIGVGYAAALNWLIITGYIVGGLILIATLLMSVNARVSECVYCGNTIGKGIDDTVTSHDENETIECPHCYELLISNKGEIRAFTTLDYGEIKHFDAPAFKEGIWQDECVVCGESTMRIEEASRAKLNAEQLLVGTLSVSSASIGNIPYCLNHSSEIELKIKDDYIYLRFPELEMRKRYLIANKGRMSKKMKIKGAFEKLVTKN